MRQTRLSHGSNKQDEATAPRAPSRPDVSPFGDVMLLQQSIGNAAVGNLVRSRERAMSESPTSVDPSMQNLIAIQAGGSEAMQSLPGGIRVHHGPKSDALTRMLGATGFTQGRDVFLRSDRDPASAAGRATLAHELTHVAQGSVGRGAVMREPDVSQAEPMDTSKTAIPAVVAKLTTDSGDINGGSQVAGHQGEVEFTSISLGVSSPGNTGVKREGDESKTTELHGSRHMDTASTELFKASIDGTPIKTARFVFIKQAPDGTINEYFTMEFKDGFITGYQVSGEYESLSFQFKGS